jgi:peptide/nickel transport system substrate-binding protein
VDKDSVHKFIYGRGGDATANVIYNPKRYASTTTSYEFNVEKAIALLDQAGWKPDSDGIRTKGGVSLKYLYQTSINQPRQKTQAIVKQACKKAGIEIEIKAVVASVFFSSDVANPDTYPHFYSDIQMYTTGPNQPDPAIFLQMFLSTEKAQKANKWQGRNITRWESAEYDKTYQEQASELDPVKRAAMLIHLNDLAIKNFVIIPVVTRPSVAAVVKPLICELSGFDSYIWDLANWYKEA